MNSIDFLAAQVRGCHLCVDKLPLGPNPVIQLHQQSRIVIAGQAPSKKVHETGMPFNDASGVRLREWLGVTSESFYDAKQFAILPMAFCYPGTGKSGDLAPRPECAEKWRAELLGSLKNIQLTLVIGQYAMAYHLPQREKNLTATVANWRAYWPQLMPLPHPSPRNNLWLKRNPWFQQEVLPELRARVATVLAKS